MELIKDLKKLGKDDVALAGGKGASLGEMMQAGIPVPSGFVILSNTFEKFLEETDLNVEIDSILHSVNTKKIHTVDNASAKIHALILGAEMSQDIETEIQKNFKKLNLKYVAVRSSATAEDSARSAWAGQLESYLNTTKENLLDNVKKCWASLFTPRAIFYRFEKNLHEQKISVAVVVQKMVESEKSGITFSVHPVTQDKNQLIIEAGFGLGEAVVSGQITPDSYVVKKQPRRIIDKNVHTQSRGLYRAKNGGNEWHNIPKKQGREEVLSDKEILELTKIIINIENHYNFPCDIEWAFEKDKFYITQSRPITTLSKINKENTSNENWIIVVSFKTELLSESIAHRGHRESLQHFFPQIPKLKNRMIIDNDIYTDLTEVLKIQDYFSTDLIKKATNAYRTIEKMSTRLLKTSEEVIKQTKNISNRELSKKLDNFFKDYQKTLGAIEIPTIIDLTIESLLKNILKDNGIKNFNKALSKIAIPFKPVETSNAQVNLLLLAEKIYKQKLDLNSKKVNYLIHKYYLNYGWLHSTLFLGNLFTEDQIKTELKKILPQSTIMRKKIELDRKKHLLEAEHIINKIKSKKSKKLAKFIQKCVYYRTTRLEWMNKACFILRPLLEVAAKRLKISFDKIIYLLPEEIITSLKKEYIDNTILKSIKERIAGYAYISDNKREYYLVTGSDLNNWKSKFSEDYKQEGNVLKGVIAFKGLVRGKVVVVKDRSELDKVQNGDILVTRLTTPDFVIVMKKAIAIVTDLGGITSHAAVTSRELKIPCIVGAKNATKFLKDGMHIEVDANKGKIKIL